MIIWKIYYGATGEEFFFKKKPSDKTIHKKIFKDMTTEEFEGQHFELIKIETED